MSPWPVEAWFVEAAPRIAIGSTIVLVVAGIAVASARDPGKRRRLGGLGLAATASYLVLALLPLPRSTAISAFGPAVPAVAPTLEIAREPVPARPPASLAATPNVPRSIAAPAAPKQGSAPPPSIAAANAHADVPTLLARGLLVLASAQVLWLVFGLVRLRAIVASSSAAPDELVRAVALPRGVKVRIARRPVRPFCCGVWRPCVVLPPDLATATPTSLAVLRHELAHLQGGDVRLQALLAALQPLLFWQPLFWWLRRQTRFDSELLADARAAGDGVHDYVRAMLALAGDAGPLAPRLSLTVFHRPSDFYRRLQMLLTRERPLSASPSRLARALGGAVALALALSCALCLGARPLAAQDPVADPTANPTAELQNLRALVADLRREIAALKSETAAATPQATTEYTVKKGDSIESILRKHLRRTASYEDVQQVLRLNPGLDISRFAVGTVLKLPPRQEQLSVPFAHLIAGDGQVGGAAMPGPVGNERHGEPATVRVTDLIDAVTRCIELRGAVELAELEVADLDARSNAGQATRLEFQRAAIGLRVKKQQLEAVEGILQVQREAAQREFERTKQLFDAGRASQAELDAAQAQLQVVSRKF